MKYLILAAIIFVWMRSCNLILHEGYTGTDFKSCLNTVQSGDPDWNWKTMKYNLVFIKSNDLGVKK